ncbi:MAG: serine/threonine protein kinase [Balneolaceae bacterium]|nr:serine/threonine protein kinase [Balneolaceae bacterium]
MDKSRWQRVSAILDTVLSLEKEKQLTYLEQHYDLEKDIIREVKEMLASINNSEKEHFLDSSSEDNAAILDKLNQTSFNLFSERQNLEGKKIGPYQIISLLGKGGMGDVYKAERIDNEFDQTVAIKFINQTHLSDSVKRRFQQEKTILANLKHPNIAMLFDGGVSQDGFPFLIMEYIEGTPINEYCNREQLGIHERLKLFNKVLLTIGYAHSNLIVHRDLKPSNILVSGMGEIKILDFGIAKLLENEDSPDPLLTQPEQRLWTPQYAAPEQVLEQSPLLQTDIYALGGLLHCLLTNTPTFNFKKKSIREVEKVILSQPPLPLNESVSPKAPSEIEQHFGTTKPTLIATLKGDLEAITQKALRKEAEERYSSASEFRDDIVRYLKNLPVKASKDTFSYLTKKFVRRNKQQLGITSFVLLLLISITGYYTYQLDQQRQTAEMEAQKATEIKDLLVDLFSGSDPISGGDYSLTVTELLNIGTSQLLEKDLAPTLKSELLNTLSDIYGNINQHQKALELATQNLELNVQHFDSSSVHAGKSYMQIASVEYDLGNYGESIEYLRKAEDIFETHLPPTDLLFAELYSHQGYNTESLSRYDESQQLFNKALNILKAQADMDSSRYIGLLRSVSRSHYLHRENKQADSLITLALDISKQFHGEDDIITASVMNDLGLFYMTQARYDESRKYLNQSLQAKKRIYGDMPHYNISATLTNLAVLEKTLSNFSVAESLYLEALEMDTEIFGKEHPNIAISKNHLSDVYFSIGEYQKSKELREEVLGLYIDIYGPTHYYMGTNYRSYGQLLSVEGKYDDANEYYIKADSVYKEYISPEHNNYAKLHEYRAENFYMAGNYTLAARHFSKSLDIYEELNPRYYTPMVGETSLQLIQSYIALEDEVKATQLLEAFENRMDTTKILQKDSTIQKVYKQVLDKLH